MALVVHLRRCYPKEEQILHPIKAKLARRRWGGEEEGEGERDYIGQQRTRQQGAREGRSLQGRGLC